MEQKKHIEELLSKPLCMMSGEEFCTLAQYVNGAAVESPARPVNRVIGIHDLAAAIGCCDSTVYMLKRMGVLDPAIISRIGKKIVFDVDKALVLAEEYQKNQRDARREARDSED